MEILMISSEAFELMIQTLLERIDKHVEKGKERWIDTDSAMELLHVKSKTTMQMLRDTGALRFTQPTPRVLLYDRLSIEKYLEMHAKNTF